MGIHDRDYYRESTKNWSYFGDHATTNGLIVANIAFYLIQRTSENDFFTQWGDFYLPAVLKGELWRLFTCHFLHVCWVCLVLWFNMMVLYWVGYEVETIYGHRETLAFYLATSLIISLGLVVLGVTGLSDPKIHILGASGPVIALFVLYALHHPHNQITIFFLLTVPARVAVFIYVAIDAFGAMGFGAKGIAYSAHLFGAGFAFLYFKEQLRILSFLPDWGRRTPRPRVSSKTYSPAATPVGVAAERTPSTGTQPAAFDEHLEARVDVVLEKMHRHGKESLTAEELEILQRASELYKRRRGG